MRRTAVLQTLRRTIRILAISMIGLVGTEALSGCLVAGYSSRGGFFVWPGSIVITLIIVLILFLLRRGR